MAAILFQILFFLVFLVFLDGFLKEKTSKFLETSSEFGQKTKNSYGKTASLYGLVSLVFLVCPPAPFILILHNATK